MLCGLVIWQSRLGETLDHVSFDLPFTFNPKVDCDELIIIKMDEQSYRRTGQKWGGQWDRKLDSFSAWVTRRWRSVVSVGGRTQQLGQDGF